MHQITLTQAMYMAGVDSSDDPWVRDVKFAAWIKEVNGKLIENQDQVVPDEAVGILILKGK
jgi:hypothetical protein